MNQESLRELLARVHERLSANSSVDNESRQLLGTLMRDIERALGGGATAVVQPQAVGAGGGTRFTTGRTRGRFSGRSSATG